MCARPTLTSSTTGRSPMRQLSGKGWITLLWWCVVVAQRLVSWEDEGRRRGGQREREHPCKTAKWFRATVSLLLLLLSSSLSQAASTVTTRKRKKRQTRGIFLNGILSLPSKNPTDTQKKKKEKACMRGSLHRLTGACGGGERRMGTGGSV